MTLPEEITDEGLMADTAAGNRTSFDTLVQRHLRRSLALAHHIVGNLGAAESVVQDAFIHVWNRAEDWQDLGPASFKNWLDRLVVERAIKHRRGRLPNFPCEATGGPDVAANAEEPMEKNSVIAVIEAAIMGLPRRQRAALSLCYFQGMDLTEAAKALHVSIPTAENLLLKARRKLWAQLHSMISRET